MDSITRKIGLDITSESAFVKFAHELNEWWPKEYTWSQDALKEIFIDVKKNGLCTEIGPYDFRCDWGRITEVVPNAKIVLKWQISVNREPIPNPDQASDIVLQFIDNKGSTVLEFEHKNFQNHGDSAEEYIKMMAGAKGWTYILNSYTDYCKKE